jgi:methylthioribose-1-phosphate isomerase
VGAPFTPIRLIPDEATIVILDQTALPAREEYARLSSVRAVCEAIRALRVRGAPLLGIAGACGMAIAASDDSHDVSLRRAAADLAATRPTAVELGAAVEAALGAALAIEPAGRAALLWQAASAMLDARRAGDARIGKAGAGLVPHGSAVLTHCNTGALATGGAGTAFAVIRCAWEEGRLTRCYATETRPLMQGARLTTWELLRCGIPATLLPDTAAAALIASGGVQVVITGADRIAANGDTANKVGTLGLALAAQRFTVPFYVAAPHSTFDPRTADGSAIPIEHRAAAEVGGFEGQRWAPEGVEAFNPAFDVTPASLITAFITDRGIILPPYAQGIASLLDER